VAGAGVSGVDLSVGVDLEFHEAFAGVDFDAFGNESKTTRDKTRLRRWV
jgi:hypothetical protein